jgi:hypothetical protein
LFGADIKGVLAKFAARSNNQNSQFADFDGMAIPGRA